MADLIDPTDLVAGADIADLFGVRTPTFSNWVTRYDDFPEPVIRVARDNTPLWDLNDIIEWAENVGQRRRKQPLPTLPRPVGPG